MKTIFSQPEVDQVGYASTGKSRTGQTIDLPRSIGRGWVDCAFDEAQLHFVITVNLLPGPERLPSRVIHFTTQTWRFAMLIEAKTDDGIGIGFERNETVKRRP